MGTKLLPKTEWGYQTVELHQDELPNDEASFAMKIINHFALVSAKPDGEDSAGRQQLALLPVDELVARACDIASATFAELRKRGLIIALPDPVPNEAPAWEIERAKRRKEAS